jgi:Holliday junction DNA helicase RuvA
VSPIARLRGVVEERGSDWLIVGVGGIGVRVLAPVTTVSALGAPGSEVLLHTHLHVREESLTLYGFATAEDLDVFQILIGVAGVGPKGALAILSAMSTDELAAAVAAGDVERLRRIPGIGQKTASRLVLELKNRLEAPAAAAIVSEPGRDEEVVSALMSLGYTQAEASEAAASVPNDSSLAVEDRLRMALKFFASQ